MKNYIPEQNSPIQNNRQGSQQDTKQNQEVTWTKHRRDGIINISQYNKIENIAGSV
jgi:hypothetical protein